MTSAADECAYCYGSLSDHAPRWVPCASSECRREVAICDACEEAHEATVGESEQLAVHCMPCWKERGSQCIVCDDAPAQNGKAFAHRCRPCVADGRDRAIAKAIDREAQEWLDVEAARPEQSWDGSEPALQLLLLPQPSSLPLAPYAQQPHALDPKHCRLCMQGLRPSGGASTPGVRSAAGVDGSEISH